MADELVQVATARGQRLRKLAIPFGGGGTDAAAFAAAGITATSVIGLPTGLFSRSQYYHTENDIVEKIEPRAVEAVIGIAVDYVRGLDEG
jgi:putative aminopeptidase FrvX